MNCITEGPIQKVQWNKMKDVCACWCTKAKSKKKKKKIMSVTVVVICPKVPRFEQSGFLFFFPQRVAALKKKKTGFKPIKKSWRELFDYCRCCLRQSSALPLHTLHVIAGTTCLSTPNESMCFWLLFFFLFRVCIAPKRVVVDFGGLVVSKAKR